MSFQFEGSKIPGLKIIIPKKFSDNRGTFSETYKKSEFTKNDLNETFVQENRSVSKKNVLRGLHYQINPKAQGKLVSVQRGKIFDVAVDIRRNSPYFGKYVSIMLESETGTMFWIPAGFAHGFLSLEDNTTVTYKTTEEYSPEHERGIIWNDPDIGIEWPSKDVIVTERDSEFPRFKQAQMNFKYGDRK
jgi:dTDP-4-dehydrorhamnose 3,5-epimerase